MTGSRRAAWPQGAALGLLVLALALAGSAHATPIYFEGSGGFGIDPADAPAGVPVLTDPALFPIDDIFALPPVQTLDPASVSLWDPGSPTTPGEATSVWTFERLATPLAASVEDDGIPDVFYVVFVTNVDAFFDDALVGLDMDPTSWALAPAGPGGPLYPAVRLGTLDPGDTTAAEIRYRFLQELPRRTGSEGLQDELPQWQIGVAIVPVPEPGTGLLLGFGAAVLAWGARRR